MLTFKFYTDNRIVGTRKVEAHDETDEYRYYEQALNWRNAKGNRKVSVTYPASYNGPERTTNVQISAQWMTFG